MLERVEGLEIRGALEGKSIECVIITQLNAWVIRMESGDIFSIAVNASGEMELWREVEDFDILHRMG